jgi:glyoxalase/bleomycin resistance protein/dioxygenase superfamily protein
MSLLWVADSFYVGSHNVAAATSWYIEKFGLKQTQIELDEGEGCVGLIFPKELPTPIVIGPISSSTNSTTRMLYTGDIEKVRELLGSRGVKFGSVETDRQGTRYFSLQDLDGNSIEISEEP